MIKMDTPKLATKIRVVSDQKKIQDYSEKHLQFYSSYAAAVKETLKMPIFQKFLRWIMKEESIQRASVTDVQVRLFPFTKENGKTLAGRCNSDAGVILIFPKPQGFLQKKMHDQKTGKIRLYLKSRAMAALIHELLHIKYDDENKVQHLTKKYFKTFFRGEGHDSEKVQALQNMLFAF